VKERAGIAEKELEGDEQCGNAEKVDETVILSAGFWVT